MLNPSRHTRPRGCPLLARVPATWIAGLAILLGAATSASAQVATVTVEETAGIRRTSFPARARFEVPAGALPGADAIQLVDGNGAEVPVQGTVASAWPDGSVRMLETDFNVSLGPLETSRLELRYGAGVSSAGGVRRGLAVSEDEASIQVGRVRFGKSGAPLVRSVAYREELIVDGPDGVVVTDDAGRRHEPSEIAWGPPRILKRGPLNVSIRYEGRLTLSGRAADLTLDLEMPNSKSWLKLTATASDPGRHVRGISIKTPISLGSYPWTWDFATPNGTYGAFRDPNGSVVFTRTVERGVDGDWRVVAGPAGGERPYEQSPAGWSGTMGGWTHLVGTSEAVAFTVAPGPTGGTFTTRLAGSGRTSFGFAPSAAAERVALTVYQHYVSTPVAIGAATSPASILNPLRVSVDPRGR